MCVVIVVATLKKKTSLNWILIYQKTQQPKVKRGPIFTHNILNNFPKSTKEVSTYSTIQNLKLTIGCFRIVKCKKC